MQRSKLVLAVSVSLILSACGSNSGGGPNPGNPATYSIGGTVGDLEGSGLVLQDNGQNNLQVTASGSFTFSTTVASGEAYDVSVLTQPSNPPQLCTVSNASGTANANIINVQVSCTTAYIVGGSVIGLVGTGLVLQDNGSDNLSVVGSGSFTFNTPVAAGATYNVTILTQPSNPQQTCAVANGSGMAYLGGNVQVSCTGGTVGEWAWVGGADVGGQTGTYGTLGVAAPGNVPGARDSAVSARDASGTFWLFGGEQIGTTTSLFNDLWKYSAGEWAWVSGSSALNQTGVYGTLGTPAPGNTPGARVDGLMWADRAGNLWLFGGIGFDSTGSISNLNDLWKYNAGQWTWMSGSSTGNQSGTYGTLGKFGPANVPGARADSVGWIDSTGNLWLFGGQFNDSANAINDLWEYSSGEWAWMGGSNVLRSPGVYGTEGTPSTSNIPGARSAAVSWVDASGNFWLFGGTGLGANGFQGFLNDLWKYSAGEWTWISGANSSGQQGTYGTPGIPAPGNVPGARVAAISWIDPTGNLWLFGGYADGGNLNDLWRYSSDEWTWMSGANSSGQTGVYGTEGLAGSGNIPGARNSLVGWSDAQGNLWLFGGNGIGNVDFNDLWMYQP